MVPAISTQPRASRASATEPALPVAVLRMRKYSTEKENLWKSNAIIQGKQQERSNFSTNRKDADEIEKKMKEANMAEYGNINTLE